MPVGRITVVRVPLATLVAGLDTTDVRAPFHGESWQTYRGEDGGAFHACALDGGTLVAPFGVFDSTEELASSVRAVLGARLDQHDDARGLFVVAGDTPPEGTYEAAVAGEGSFVPVPAAAEAKAAGWSFAAAAGALASPDAKKRVEERAEEDPFASAKATFDQKLAAREDRGALRRTLSAALNHEVEHSALGEAASSEDEKAEVGGEAADKLRRALAASPDKVTALEGALRAAVDGEIAREEDIDAARVPPKAD